MNGMDKLHFRLRLIAASLLIGVSFFAVAGPPRAFAHGGEDHGEKKPEVTTADNGTVSRTMRVGDLELLLKHSLLEPDAAAAGGLFLTRFTTNEPLDAADIRMEVESANGSVTQILTEKTEAPGTFTLKIPALPEGSYTLRATTAIGGKTETATFSGVEVAHKGAPSASTGDGSWAGYALTGLLFLIGVSLFSALVYLAARVLRDKPLSEEAVSA